MTYVLDNPSQNGALILDDPTEVQSGTGYTAQGVLGTATVTAFIATLSIGYEPQAQLGSVDVQGFVSTLQTTYESQGVLGSVDVQGRFAGFEAAAGGLLDGITDPDGDPLSLEIITPPPNGTFVWDVNGAFTFTPDPGWYGQTEGEYRVWAGGEASNTETFTIHIAPNFVGVLGSVDVQGAAPELVITHESQAILGSVNVQGFQAGLIPGQGYVAQGSLSTVSVSSSQAAMEGNYQGAPGSTSVQGFVPALEISFAPQAQLGQVGVQGFQATLETTFDVQGVQGSTSVQAFAGSLQAQEDYIAAGSLSNVVVQGFSAGLQAGTGYVASGTLGDADVQGFVGQLNIGYIASGQLGQASVQAFQATLVATSSYEAVGQLGMTSVEGFTAGFGVFSLESSVVIADSTSYYILGLGDNS